VTVAAGTSAQMTVETTLTSGSPEAITLSVPDLPSGMSASFHPPLVKSGDSAALTLAVADDAPPGTVTLTVLGTAPSGTHATSLSVMIPPNDFSMVLEPSSGSLPAGGHASIIIKTALVSGAGEPIHLEASSLPSGVTGSVEPPSLYPGANATLTLSALDSTPDSTSSIKISGTARSATHSANAALRTLAAPTVTVTAPRPGTLVSRYVTLSAVATVSTYTGLREISMYVDDVLVGSLTPPQEGLPWDSTTVADGPHVIQAKVVDAFGGTRASAPIDILVRNQGSPPVVKVTGCGCGTEGSAPPVTGVIAALLWLSYLLRRRTQPGQARR